MIVVASVPARKVAVRIFFIGYSLGKSLLLTNQFIAHFIMCAGGSSLRKHFHRTLGPKWETLEIAGTP
jgi:hypothetical protein